MNFQIIKLDLEKAEEPEIKLPTSTGSLKKQESSRKTSTTALLTIPKPLTVFSSVQFSRSVVSDSLQPHESARQASLSINNSHSSLKLMSIESIQPSHPLLSPSPPALNMPANLEHSAVATGLEKVSFHSNPKERQYQRMLKLLHNCTHLTR